MKKLTVRVSDELWENLELISYKNKISANKLICNILEYYKNTIDIFDEIKKNDINIKLNNIEQLLKYIKGKNLYLTNLLEQIFANSGFAKNISIDNDKVFKDFQKKFNNNFEK